MARPIKDPKNLTEIYIVRWRGAKNPRTNRFSSSDRKILLERSRLGQIVLVMSIETSKVWVYGNWGAPAFEKIDDALSFYRGYSMEVEN